MDIAYRSGHGNGYFRTVDKLHVSPHFSSTEDIEALGSVDSIRLIRMIVKPTGRDPKAL